MPVALKGIYYKMVRESYYLIKYLSPLSSTILRR